MTPEQARAAYRRQIRGTVILRRVGTPNIDATVRARVTGYAPEELVGGILQGDRKVILLAEDVETAEWPTPIKNSGTDKIVVRGKTLNVQAVDDSTRRVDGVLIAYEITVRG